MIIATGLERVLLHRQPFIPWLTLRGDGDLSLQALLPIRFECVRALPLRSWVSDRWHLDENVIKALFTCVEALGHSGGNLHGTSQLPRSGGRPGQQGRT